MFLLFFGHCLNFYIYNVSVVIYNDCSFLGDYMKHLSRTLILATSLLLSGCGKSNDNRYVNENRYSVIYEYRNVDYFLDETTMKWQITYVAPDETDLYTKYWEVYLTGYYIESNSYEKYADFYECKRNKDNKYDYYLVIK